MHICIFTHTQIADPVCRSARASVASRPQTPAVQLLAGNCCSPVDERDFEHNSPMCIGGNSNVMQSGHVIIVWILESDVRGKRKLANSQTKGAEVRGRLAETQNGLKTFPILSLSLKAQLLRPNGFTSDRMLLPLAYLIMSCDLS